MGRKRKQALTKNELDLLGMAHDSFTYGEIANATGKSVHTV